jgi:hypothetical protein
MGGNTIPDEATSSTEFGGGKFGGGGAGREF